MKNEEKYWIFDVCGTLYISNTTFDFLEFFFNKFDSSRLLRLRKIGNKKRPSYWFKAVLFRYFNLDLFRKEAVALLEGYDAHLIYQEAHSFLHEVLRSKEIQDTFSILRKQSDKTILVSNSIEPVVKAIAESLNLEFIATVLEEKEGILTGRIIRDITGKKHHAISKLGITRYSVVTDNRSDYALVKNANDSFVVIHSEEEKIFWDKLHPNYILV